MNKEDKENRKHSINNTKSIESLKLRWRSKPPSTFSQDDYTSLYNSREFTRFISQNKIKPETQKIDHIINKELPIDDFGYIIHGALHCLLILSIKYPFEINKKAQRNNEIRQSIQTKSLELYLLLKSSLLDFDNGALNFPHYLDNEIEIKNTQYQQKEHIYYQLKKTNEQIHEENERIKQYFTENRTNWILSKQRKGIDEYYEMLDEYDDETLFIQNLIGKNSFNLLQSLREISMRSKLIETLEEKKVNFYNQFIKRFIRETNSFIKEYYITKKNKPITNSPSLIAKLCNELLIDTDSFNDTFYDRKFVSSVLNG